MKTISQTVKDFIQANTLKDSGVITWESYHSADNLTFVTNINIGPESGFFADRVYTLQDNKKTILVSKSQSEILDKYTEIMTSRYKKEIDSLMKIDLVYTEEEIREPIQNAIYATGSYTTDQCTEFADGILTYLTEAGYKVVRQ